MSGSCRASPGHQARRTLDAAGRLAPRLAQRIRRLYSWDQAGKPDYGPPGSYSARLGLLIRELCGRHSLADRMPRHVAPGPLAINRRIAERLFLKTYDLELEQAGSGRIWAYRRAAWSVDELALGVDRIHQEQGDQGLEMLPGVGSRIAEQIARWIGELSRDRRPCSGAVPEGVGVHSTEGPESDSAD